MKPADALPHLRSPKAGGQATLASAPSPSATQTPVLAPLLLPWDVRLTPEQCAKVWRAQPDDVLELAADGTSSPGRPAVRWGSARGRHVVGLPPGGSRPTLGCRSSPRARRVTYLQEADHGGATRGATPLAQSQPSDPSVDAGRHFQEAIRRWGNSLEVRLPAHCLRLAGLQEGDRIVIVVGADGRLSLEPLQRQDRSALTADWLRQAGLQATMPLTPSVIEECRDCERW